jgi:hypothetical protein
VAVRIRRRLTTSLVTIALTVALTLPLEVVLLEALTTTSTEQAVYEWVADLSTTELDQVAAQIGFYPVAYRKEIMRALSPVRRSQVWRDHIRTYAAERPWLPADALPVLEAALTLATPEALSAPTDASRAQIRLVAEQVEAMLGREEAEYVLYRLGPRDDLQVASAEPLRMRLANYVRSLMVAQADLPACSCAIDWGCDGYSTHCSSLSECEPDEEWPMCGWLWQETCDGRCASGAEGS